MAKKAAVELSAAELKRLVREIAVAAERAFRRGFHHGHCCGERTGCFAAGATAEAVEKFRDNRDSERSDVPPGSALPFSSSAAARLGMETGDLPELSHLLHLAKRETPK